MDVIALILIGVVFSFQPIELEKGAIEIDFPEFMFPVAINAARRAEIHRLHLFVSQDRGKTWKHHKDVGPEEKGIRFSAPHDGMYWFGLQTEMTDGGKDPSDLKDLVPLKIYVNSAKRPVKNRPKSHQELEKEVEELRQTVERLKQRVKELESASKEK